MAISEASLDHVYGTVYKPVFFQKLASFGIVPRTVDEEAKLLALGASQYAGYLEHIAKQASAQGDLISDAYTHYLGESPEVELNQRYKLAAAQWMNDPTTRAAAFALASGN